MKTVRLFFASIFVVFSSANLCAETWINFTSPPSMTRGQIDLDSLVLQPGGGVKATIRRPGINSRVEEVTAIFHCNDWYYEQLNYKIIETDPPFSKVNGRVVYERNYEAKTLMQSKSTSSMSEAEHNLRFETPTRFSSQGSELLRSICFADNNENQFLDEVGKVANDFIERFICNQERSFNSLCGSKSIDQLFPIFLSTKKLALTKEMGKERFDDYKKIYAWVVEKASRCRAKDDCVDPFSQFAYGAMRDYLLRDSVASENTYLYKAKKSYDSEKEEAAGMREFYICTNKKVKELDDRVSSVETIAKAAIASCRYNLLPNSSLKNDDIFNIVGGDLAAAILSSRAKKRK